MAETIQRFNSTCSSQNRPRHGQPKKLSACAPSHIQRLCLGNRRMSAASIAGGAACQCSDHTPHTASNRSAWLSSQKEASSKDDAQERESWSGAAWVLPALGSYSSLREIWMPTCTETYWSRACMLGTFFCFFIFYFHLMFCIISSAVNVFIDFSWSQHPLLNKCKIIANNSTCFTFVH